MKNGWITLATCCFLLLPFMAFGERVTVEVTVIGEEGEPVEGATVAMSFLLGIGSNYEKDSTNSEGKVKVTNNADFGVSMTAMKEGYYHSSLRTGYGDQDVTLVLREKKNPIAMYAKQWRVYAPSNEKRYSLDFLKGELLPPHGSGSNSDVVIEADVNVISREIGKRAYDRKLRFIFPNKLDGVVIANIDESWRNSEYKFAYQAPEDGYSAFFEVTKSRGVGGSKVEINVETPLFVRIRTKLDDEGNIISAHYCKIPSGITPIGAFAESSGFKITYYCNPTPNDRNVEFDVSRNLFKDLEITERPTAP